MQRQTTKRAIIYSFRELLKRQSFDTISVEEICGGAGVSRRTFYRYFMDKYDLLNGICEDDFQMQQKQGQDSSVDSLLGMCNCFYQDKRFYQKAFLVEGQNSFHEYCQKKLLQNFTEDTAQMSQGNTMFIHMTNYLAEAVYETIHEWVEDGCQMQPEPFVEDLRYMIKLVGGYMYHGKVSKEKFEKI